MKERAAHQAVEYALKAALYLKRKEVKTHNLEVLFNVNHYTQELAKKAIRDAKHIIEKMEAHFR